MINSENNSVKPAFKKETVAITVTLPSELLAKIDGHSRKRSAVIVAALDAFFAVSNCEDGGF